MMTPAQLDELLAEVSAVAEEAGQLLRARYEQRDQLTVEIKGQSDFVSEADREAEDHIQGRLRALLPRAGWLLEERGQGGSQELRWVVDPLDGTTNFLHGIPHFAVSVALQEGQELLLGVVLQPLTGELFRARRGGGAWLGSQRLRCTQLEGLESAVLATGVPHRGSPWHAHFERQLRALRTEVAGIRRWGAAALDLAWVAAGRFDGFWESGLNPWDVAAGGLLIEEAGGGCLPLYGEPHWLQGSLLAAGPGILPDLERILSAASQLR